VRRQQSISTLGDVEVDWGTVRVRATSYVTRVHVGQQQLLVFDYPSRPNEPAVLPGGGVEPGERPDHAAIREVIEETGIGPGLTMQGVVGVQQGKYDTGQPCIDIFFHLNTTEPRTQWVHRMIGDPSAWDTGLAVSVRFEPINVAAQQLAAAGYKQDEFIAQLVIPAF
jgi:8-oxo-dGTP pyrophosphatase MutT (NUDIX family)